MPRVGAAPIVRAGTAVAGCVSATGTGDEGTAPVGAGAGAETNVGAGAGLVGAEEGVAAAGPSALSGTGVEVGAGAAVALAATLGRAFVWDAAPPRASVPTLVRT